MEKLRLLFTEDGLWSQVLKGKSVVSEHYAGRDEWSPSGFVEERLRELLAKEYGEIMVFSAYNHFALVPEGFSEHDRGFDLLALNSDVDREKEELMLSVNKKYGVQFYYSFPLNFYKLIKSRTPEASFNFSGEKFLNTISARGGKEIHVNLYHNQCEFFALEDRKVLLYNNLDLNSEVDFLYFVMFTLSKIGFGLKETYFFVYGETAQNPTFISELDKFAEHMKIVFDNLPKKHFILN